MTKTSINLQDLRRKIYTKAKADQDWKSWGIYIHICKLETLYGTYKLAKQNNGSPGIDGVSFNDVEAEGVYSFLKTIRDELVSQTYRPFKNRKQGIPKSDGKTRILSIPAIRDRVVQVG